MASEVAAVDGVFRPLVVYMHAGHTLHPKLAYKLPSGMGEALSSMALFVRVRDCPADVDMSSLPWSSDTIQADGIEPDPLMQHTTM